jgi:hypothetical protein
MLDRDESLAALRPRARARLDAFAQAFDRVDASQYLSLTEAAPTPAVLDAQERALELIRDGPGMPAVRAAVEAFVDAASQAYSRRISLTDTLLLYQSLPDRADDRARFLSAVERAIVGLILWDELESDGLAALIGPWGGVVENLGLE